MHAWAVHAGKKKPEGDLEAGPDQAGKTEMQAQILQEHDDVEVGDSMIVSYKDAFKASTKRRLQRWGALARRLLGAGTD
jgi:L-2-hydroxyglutarate oxidase LhgO